MGAPWLKCTWEGAEPQAHSGLSLPSPHLRFPGKKKKTHRVKGTTVPSSRGPREDSSGPITMGYSAQLAVNKGQNPT